MRVCVCDHRLTELVFLEEFRVLRVVLIFPGGCWWSPHSTRSAPCFEFCWKQLFKSAVVQVDHRILRGR